MMLLKMFHGLLLIFVFLSLCGCDEPEKVNVNDLYTLQGQIVAKVKQDMPALGVMESTYGMVFRNQKAAWIFSDDFYIREDVARIAYGYPLNKLDIQVIEEKGKRVLWAKLPPLERLATDRQPVKVTTVRESYKPVDSNGNVINLEEWMTKSLEKAVAQYEKKTKVKAREMTEQYFENLARRFELRLKLEFSAND